MAVNSRRLVPSVKGQVRECEEGTAGRVNDNNSNKPNQNQLGAAMHTAAAVIAIN